MNRGKKANPVHTRHLQESLTDLLESALPATAHHPPAGQQTTGSHRAAINRLNAELSALEGYQPITSRDIGLMVRATITAPNLAQAIRYMADFSQMVFPRIGILSLERTGKMAILRLDTRRHHPSRGACLLDTIGLLQYYQLVQWLLGVSLPLSGLSLGYADHALVKPILPLFGCTHITVATRYALTFDAGVLARPITTRPEDVDQYIRTLPVQLIGRSAAAPLLRHQVMSCLETAFERGTPVPQLSGLAATLAMSESTMRRRLLQEGASYSTLLEDARRIHAQRYLDHTDLTVEAIAWRLGFSDARALRRAFHRWTGLPPSSVRQGKSIVFSPELYPTIRGHTTSACKDSGFNGSSATGSAPRRSRHS